MSQNGSPNAKKICRKQNKIKKMKALCMISNLNDEDRKKLMMGANFPCEEEVNENSSENESKKRKYDEMDENRIKGNTKLLKRKFDDDELKLLRQQINARFAAKKKLPNIQLKSPGFQASIDHPHEHRVPLFLSDVQHFIIYSLLGHMTTGNIPRWASIKKFTQLNHVLVLVVEGMSLSDYNKYEDLCPTLKEFPHKLEVVTPLSYGACLIRELTTVPLTESQRHRLEKKFGSMGEAESSSGVIKALRTMFPMGTKGKCNEGKNNECKRNAFSRTELLLSPWQMVEEGYPLLLKGEMKKTYAHFVFTKDKYNEVTPNSPMWALDCEMCMTAKGNELTRITIINEQFEQVYDTYVKPYNPITNYLTRFSGITAELLENVETRLEDVQNKLREIIPPDLILVGHSLNSDLQALQMLHPYCIDTSVIFNISGERTRKTKLKILAAEFLGERIQMGQEGHDSNEDATACMKLVLAKLQHSVEWGDAVISGVRAVEEVIIEARSSRQKILESQKREISSTDVNSSQDKTKNQKPIHEHLPIVRMKNSLPKHVHGTNVAQVQMFTTSLFTHLISRKKKCVLVTKNSLVNEFVRYIPKVLRPFDSESRLTITGQETGKAIVKFGRRNVPNSGSSLMYNVIEREPEQTAVKVNNLVTKLTKNLSGNVLIAVLLAGRTTELDEVDTNNHGVFMLKLQPEFIPPVQLPRDVVEQDETCLNVPTTQMDFQTVC